MNDQIKNMDTLMVQFLQGNCTEEEKSQFLSWLNGDNEKEVPFFQMKEIYDSRKRVSVETQNLASLQQQHIPPKTQNSAYLHRRPQPLFERTWFRYAAIFAVLFGASFVVYLFQHRLPAADPIVYVNQMVIHNTRGVYAVTLPDGSKVWLHGATTLTYPDRFSDSIRTVNLQGEAYFAVQADEVHPFVVQTPTAKVRATGTEFNITAYPDDRVTTTTLVKGVVNIQPNHLATSIQLKPGQQALAGMDINHVRVSDVATTKTPAKIEKEKEMPVVVQEINTDLYTDWKDGVYRFKNEPFHNIALRLEKMYGVNIHIEHIDLRSAVFSGMFTTDNSLKEVFEIINLIYPISYTVKEKFVSISNKKN